MAVSRVKRKFPGVIVLASAAGLTALASWMSLIPSSWVEREYARRLFPTISRIAGFFADAIPFSWMDLWIVAGVYTIVYSLIRRKWRLLVDLICAGYLIFFWGWGLNYHRPPLEVRLGLDGLPTPTGEELSRLTSETANDLNRLWPIVARKDSRLGNPEAVARLATDRVRYVLFRMDGTDWAAATRVKHSYLADWWFRIAGIDGVFNPFGHEPILVGGVLDFERPFLMAHELAHVHGIADEGDANYVAYLAAAESADPGFQYSAAFEMWLNLYGPAALLDPGPRQDLRMEYDRIRSQEIPQATRLQSAILDSHLKANGVQAGVESYSKFVALAIATRSRWPEFR